MKVVEKFTSINGEGTRAGELAVFVRFKGCNLRCSYCDTLWANEPECPYNEETPEEILNYVLGTGIHNVTLTGGEPLLQKDIRNLIHLLLQAGLQVEVETNGAVALAAFCEERPVFTMDYKLPSSGCEEHMITENMKLLERNDTVKFVSVVAGIILVASLGSLIKTPPDNPKKRESVEPVFNVAFPEGNQFNLLTVSAV